MRERKKQDGTVYFSVTYRRGGRGSRQSSTSFPDKTQADRFCGLVASLGIDKALEVAGISDTPQRTMSSQTVTEFLTKHIDGLSGRT